MERVFLDMDGVVADIYAAICNKLGIINPYLYASTHGVYDVFDMFDKDDLSEDYAFWRDMPPMPDALEIYDFAASIGEVAFLTHPMRSGSGSMLGKVHWRDKYFPDVPLFFAIDGDKSWMGNPNCWLIDDFQHNILQFKAKWGGRGVLVPRPWNVLHKFSWSDSATFKCLRTTVEMYRSGHV